MSSTSIQRATFLEPSAMKPRAVQRRTSFAAFSSCMRRTTSFDPATTKPKDEKVQRRTSFATIAVREYEQTIGDSPSCLEGAPVTLGWSFQENQEISLDDYEDARQPYRRRRSDLVLGVEQRRKKLVESGVSISDVLRAESLVSLKKKSASRKEPKTETLKEVNIQSANKPEHKGRANQRRLSPPLQKQFEHKGKANQRRITPPLQKQMASRAA